MCARMHKYSANTRIVCARDLVGGDVNERSICECYVTSNCNRNSQVSFTDF